MSQVNSSLPPPRDLKTDRRTKSTYLKEEQAKCSLTLSLSLIMLCRGNVCTTEIKLRKIKNKNPRPENSWGKLNSHTKNILHD